LDAEMVQRRTRTTCYQPRSSVYTGCAFAVVARVDASGASWPRRSGSHATLIPAPLGERARTA